MELDLNGKSILITGGTGSFGRKFTANLLEKYSNIKRLIIYSRDELKQFEMAQKFPIEKYKCLRYFIGDVRDAERMRRACEDVDIIVHAAALKQVPAAEYNPMECIKTNIIGAENVINAALDRGVKHVVALSTDKAAAPINLYGATKLCSDKLFVAANNIRGHHEIRFSVVRYGNVIGSRGSVIPFFMEKRKTGVLPITHRDMTRFNISLDAGIDLVLYAIKNAWGGEIFVPKLPSYRIMDVAKATGPDCTIEEIGIRPGEKIHEEMITTMDSLNTVELKDYYVICPNSFRWTKEDFIKNFDGKEVPYGFNYSSEKNDNWLTIAQIRKQVKEHIDPNFSV